MTFCLIVDYFVIATLRYSIPPKSKRSFSLSSFRLCIEIKDLLFSKLLASNITSLPLLSTISPGDIKYLISELDVGFVLSKALN